MIARMPIISARPLTSTMPRINTVAIANRDHWNMPKINPSARAASRYSAAGKSLGGGIENVQLNTSDTSSPFVLIQAIPHRVGLGDKIRNQVEIIRQQKGVREIDVE